MSIRLLGFLLFTTLTNAEIMLLHTNTPANDPHHTHCEDVKADMSDSGAQEWWSANAWNYPSTQGWTNGSLCDTKVYPDIEHQNNPIGVHSVTLRRLGHTSDAVELLTQHAPRLSKYEVGDNHCTNLVIDFSKNSSECLTYEWWTENSWHYDAWSNGSCPKPYTSLDRDEHPIAVPCIDLYSYGAGQLVEPLVELKDETMVIHNIAPGGQHCTELYWEGGKENEYWKEHGYQYPQPLWMPDKCDRKKYNWWNRNSTVASGVTSETWGIHI